MSVRVPTILTKVLVALTGLVMVGFVFAHMAGNLLVYLGPAAINAYAAKLEELGPFLWLARLVLLTSLLVHTAGVVLLTAHNRQARPVGYARHRPVRSTWASRHMMLSGLTILGFIVYHLAHFTFKLTHATAFAALEEGDVYGMLVLSFKSLPVSAFYIVAITLLMVHLSHGIRSLAQTLALPRLHACLRVLGPLLALFLGCGFVSIPVAVLAGILK